MSSYIQLYGYPPPPVRLKLHSAYMFTSSTACDYIMFIGAVLYLQQFYKILYLICHEQYKEQLKEIYKHFSNIVLVLVKDDEEAHSFIQPKYNETRSDIFISGHYRPSATKNIQNWIKFQHNESDTHDKEETFIPSNSYFDYVRSMYFQLHLDFSTYIHCWRMPYRDFQCPKMPDNETEYKLVFVDNTCQDSKTTIDLSFVTNYYIDHEDVLIISTNKSTYPENHPRHAISKQFINLPYWSDYFQIIKASHEIHMIDSHLANIVFPLFFQGNLAHTNVNIYDRYDGHRISLIDF
jgi:hypothetical protein